MWLPQLDPQSRHLRLLWAIILLPGLAVLILANFNPNSSDLPSTEAATIPEQRSQSPLQAELVTVTPTGFEPIEISRPQGRFLFAIDNRSGMEELDLYLERETGGRVNVPLSRRGKLAWREAVDLPQGTYVLRATNDESWRCRIMLTK